jgi:hypothetical protein
MKRYGRCLIVGLTVLAGVCVAAGLGQAGGGKKDPWQPILTKEVFKELVKREAEKIQQVLSAKPDEDTMKRAAFGAVLIYAYTKSVKAGAVDDLDGTANKAVMLYAAIRDKGGLEQAKKLTADLLAGNTKAGAKAAFPKELDKLLTNAELMDHFRTLAKGGDGIHPDLQNNLKFKGALNGIEEKVRYLSLKELSPAGIKKEAKELELLGYRTSVVGALTYLYAPPTKMGPKDPDDWRRFSLAMRDSAVDMAAAAAKGDVAAVFRAGNALNSSCSQCHSEFRVIN